MGVSSAHWKCDYIKLLKTIRKAIDEKTFIKINEKIHIKSNSSSGCGPLKLLCRNCLQCERYHPH